MKTVILIASFLALTACHKEAEAVEKTVVPVRVAPVELYQPKGGARYSASILPGRQVSLAFRVSGIVTDLKRVGGRGLEPGDMVAAGTVLATLRQADYEHSSAQAESQLQGARESLRSANAQLAQVTASQTKAEADFVRAKTLFESQSLTRPDYDSAKAQLDVAIAQVQAARAQVAAAAAQIRTAQAGVATAQLAQTDTALAAPFAASVMERNVEVGMLAGPSMAAYTLADIGTVKAAFGVPDTVVVALKPGRTIAIAVEALPGREFRGTVSSIAAVADPETRLFQVEVAIVNRNLALKPGMIASLTLDDASPAPEIAVVPIGSVIRDPASPADFAVMVVEGNVAKARRVSLGQTFGELLAVTSGLQPGERVIRAGGTMVSDGEVVEVLQ